MGINGTIGRVHRFARIQREGLARAAKAGIDITDRGAVWRFATAEANATLAGIQERSRCRCGGARHDVITAPRRA